MMKKTALALSLLSLGTLTACHKKEDEQHKAQSSLSTNEDDDAKSLANRRAATRPVQTDNMEIRGY